MIRLAMNRDLVQMVAMGERCHHSLPNAATTRCDADTMAQTAYALINGGPQSCVLLLEVDGDVVGMLGLLLYAHPLFGEKMVTGMFWWVEPAYRGHGLELLRAAETWAREHDAAALQMATPHPEFGRVYARLGYAQLETIHQKRFTCKV